MGALKPEEGQPKKFAQIYIHDPQEAPDVEVERRLQVKSANSDEVSTKPSLKPEIMKELQEMLHELNPYVKLFKAMAELEDEYEVGELTFFLTRNKKPGTEHQGIYNLPTCDEVALMHVGEKTENADFQVYLRSGQVRYMSGENQACDPMLYILLFPEGNPGWTYGNKTSKNKNISSTMWYKFLFQVREERFTPVWCTHI